ncbi:MAG TPA: vWA domain-containing protein [Verrucomicrobiae bacterium]|nr:vWA domain-containing protein [Verrucomicrobiae bacterium]
MIPIVIRDARGELIHGFSTGDLEVMVNGTPLNISGIGRESRQRRIVILLDASGSMRGAGKDFPWRQAIASAKLLTSFSEGRARLALLIFNVKVIEEIAFGSDNSAIAKRLNELGEDQKFLDQSVQGTTALFDAMRRALELLGQPTSADEIFLVSDGLNNHSHLTGRELQQRLAESGVRVFVSLLQPSLGNQSRVPVELMAGPDWSEFAERTGGGIMFLSPTEVVFAFQARPRPSLSEGLRIFFDGMFANEILQGSVANQNLKKRDLRIALSASARYHLKGAQLSYPRQLYACPQDQSVSDAH